RHRPRRRHLARHLRPGRRSRRPRAGPRWGSGRCARGAPASGRNRLRPRGRRRSPAGIPSNPHPRGRITLMGRKILFVTTDQQRYDTLGCNGGQLARTPVVDALAAQGVRYERAVPQSVVCMPSRSTMLTGQHQATHGVWMNGVALPVDAPSVAATLHDAGYRTALIGKPHFEPFIDPFGRFTENRLASSGEPTAESRRHGGGSGPHRGFEHLEFATHGPTGWLHYARWLGANHPEAASMYYRVLDGELEVNDAGGGDTGAP